MMIDIILIIITVMFGTLFYSKQKRGKFVLKENFTLELKDAEMTPSYTFQPSQGGNVTTSETQTFTPSYAGFLNNYANFGSSGYGHGTPQQTSFSTYSLNTNMESYQPIDYDNNIASLYGYKSEGYDTTPKNTVLTCTSNDGLMGMNRWCGCETTSTDSASGTTETATRRLFGGVNPRTLIPPKIVPPITDIEEWGTDNYTIHSATNNHKSDELFLSGYITLDNCKCQGVCRCNKVWSKPFIKEGFERSKMDHNYLSPYDVSEQRTSRPQILQNYAISKVPEKSVYSSITNGEEFSFVEKCRKETMGGVDYITGDEPSMIYDPRMVGYSDSKRGYVDKLLGQPKFYYDDINAARAPNYITRNKIDIYSFGESTGRLRDPKDPQTCGDNNQLAVEEFHNSALQHRSDMMQSLMNKRNGEMWQLRQFPISTNGQRMLGGTSKI